MKRRANKKDGLAPQSAPGRVMAEQSLLFCCPVSGQFVGRAYLSQGLGLRLLCSSAMAISPMSGAA